MNNFFDIYHHSLNHHGEELCGDHVKLFRSEKKSTIVLSDGLGSGVKASILATLTSEIIITMLKENIQLKDVIETVIGTLPTCQVRKIAYATFTIIEIDHDTEEFTIVNFDNPPVLWLRNGKIHQIHYIQESISGKLISRAKGVLSEGDFLGMISDGIMYAGLGTNLNFGWGWEQTAAYIEDLFQKRVFSTHAIVNNIIAKTRILYGNIVGDDATVVGIYARPRNSVMVFTGPPLDESYDFRYVDQLLSFQGRKIICGGTTANIVASFMKADILTDISTLSDELPPMGSLEGIDLVTEGIITMAKCLENIKTANGNLYHVPVSNTGAYHLTRELLLADSIKFLVGQKINAYYQNPLLPKNISIRRNLVEQLADVLTSLHKEVSVDYC